MKQGKKSLAGIVSLIFCLSICFAFLYCDDGGDDSDNGTYCEDYEPCDGVTAKACGNDDGEGWYEYDGEKYYCTGSGTSLDCEQAATDVYTAACTG